MSERPPPRPLGAPMFCLTCAAELAPVGQRCWRCDSWWRRLALDVRRKLGSVLRVFSRAILNDDDDWPIP
jgi:hypothetical protein